MKELDFPIDRINLFLKNHVFTVDTEFGKTNSKVQLTGEKDYLTLGTPLPYIQYTLYILPSSPEVDKIYDLMFHVWGDELIIWTKSSEFSEIRYSMKNLLKNLLKYMGVDKGVICTKIVNNLNSDVPI